MLVAPFFIDWSDHRAVFEREASVLIGHPVRVKGEADAQILPIPTFTFTNVEVGKPGGEPLMSTARVKLRLELIPLLQRQFDVIDMELDTPQVSIRLNKAGGNNWNAQDFQRRLAEDFTIRLGPVRVRDGAIYAADEEQGKSLQLKKIDAVVTAQSIIGPWKFEGSAEQASKSFAFKASTGKFADGKVRMKTKIEPDTVDFDIALDGELAFGGGGAGAAETAYKGTLAVEPRLQREGKGDKQEADVQRERKSWQLTGGFALKRDSLTLADAVFEDGNREAPLNLNGNIDIPFSPEIGFSARVSSRQIDLDRAYGKGRNEPLSLGAAQNVLADVIRALPKPSIPGEIAVDVPGIVVAGDVMRSVHFRATPTDAGWQIDDFGAILPGATQVGFSGNVATGDALSIDGGIFVRSDQPVSLARWLRPESGDDARRIGIGQFAMEGRLSVEPAAIRLTEMKADLDRSDLAGRLSFSMPSKRLKRFDATLSANTLDVDAIEALRALFIGRSNLSGFGADDTIALKLSAKKLVSQALEGRDADIDIRIANGEIDVATMKIADFAGVNIDLSGTMRNVLTTPAGRFSGTIKAGAVDGLVKIGEALMPDHPALLYLRRHGGTLMPLDIAVNFSGDAAKAGRNVSSSDFAATITGTVGGGTVKAGARFQGDWTAPLAGAVEASFNADYADSADFLRQAGWAAVDTHANGSAAIDIRANGTPESGIAVKTEMAVNGIRLDGTARLAVSDIMRPRYDGTFSLGGEDGEPLLRLLGISLPATGLGMDADLKGRIEGEGWNGDIAGLSGTLGGGALKADLHYEGAPQGGAPWKWRGKVAVERASLPWFAALVTGEIVTPIDLEIPPENIATAGDTTDDAEDTPLGSSFWSRAEYGPPYLSGIQADLEVEAGKMDVTYLRELENAAFKLRLRPESMELNEIAAGFAQGALSGSLRFENAEGAVTASGILNLHNASAADLLWTDENRPLVEGRLSLSTQFSGTGRSLDAIIGTLGGGGSVMLEKGRVRRLNPSAFGLLVEASDRNIVLDDETVRPLAESHLDAGALAIDKAESTFTIGSGVVRVANASLNLKALNAVVGATFDLPQMTLKGSMALTVDAAAVDDTPVAGSTPEIAILFDGPIERPARTLDLQPLLGYLTVRRFEQEVRRVEILQADILERQRLSRYARWISAEEEREAREAAATVAREAERLRLEKIRTEETKRLGTEGEAARRQAASRNSIRPASREQKIAPQDRTNSTEVIKREALGQIDAGEELRHVEREKQELPPLPLLTRPLELVPHSQ